MTGLLPKLIQAAQRNSLALFLGAGSSLGDDIRGEARLGEMPLRFPSWRELPMRLLCECMRLASTETDRRTLELKRELLKAVGEDLPLNMLLAELDVLREYLLQIGEVAHREALESIFDPSWARPGELHSSVCELDPLLIITTNYDTLVESRLPAREVFTWRESAAVKARCEANKPLIWKIHGCVRHPSSIVLTRREYDVVAGFPAYLETLKYVSQRFRLLFAGYGMSDPHDVDVVLGSSAEIFGGYAQQHFALLKEDQCRASAIRKWNTVLLPYRSHRDVAPFLRRLARAKRNVYDLDTLRALIERFGEAALGEGFTGSLVGISPPQAVVLSPADGERYQKACRMMRAVVQVSSEWDLLGLQGVGSLNAGEVLSCDDTGFPSLRWENPEWLSEDTILSDSAERPAPPSGEGTLTHDPTSPCPDFDINRPGVLFFPILRSYGTVIIGRRDGVHQPDERYFELDRNFDSRLSRRHLVLQVGRDVCTVGPGMCRHGAFICRHEGEGRRFCRERLRTMSLLQGDKFFLGLHVGKVLSVRDIL